MRAHSRAYLLALFVVVIAGAWLLLGGDDRPLDVQRNEAGAAARSRRPHYVTPEQLQASNAKLENVVADLSMTTSDSRALSWSALSDGAPVVLVFVKKGCPCSIEFAPYFQQVAARYRGSVRFADVIDGDTARAGRWKREHDVPYTVIADAEQHIIRRFGAENGGYVALLARDGQIDRFWPGFSRDALSELGARIAQLTGRSEQRLDPGSLPAALTSGCPFVL